MEFRILGPLEVVDRGRTLALGGPKQRALLAALLLTPNRAVSVDRLIDALWPTRPPAAAANALQFHVSQLRKLLGDAGDRHAGAGIPDPGRPGSGRPASASSGWSPTQKGPRPPGPAVSLSEALDLWRGEPLADLADDRDLAGGDRSASRLRVWPRSICESRLISRSAVTAQLVPELRGARPRVPAPRASRGRVDAARSTEPAARRKRSRSIGRRGRRFVDELGIEPSPALRELEQAILRQDARARAGLCRPGVALDRGARRGRAPPRRPARPRGATCESAQARAHPHAFHN